MKQHITYDQLNNFLEYKIVNGDASFNKNKVRKLNEFLGIASGRKYPTYWNLNIGKLMEILDNRYTEEEIFISRLEDFTWTICFGLENVEENDGYDFEISEVELVDALWAAVGEVLL